MERASEGVANSENPARAEAQKAGGGGEDARSNYGAIPGEEFPVAVYVSVFAALIWVVVAAWVAFGSEGDADMALGMARVLTAVFFALPILVRLTAMSHSRRPREAPGDFLASGVETATGTLPGASAWLQIVLIPAALALAATLIGATFVLMH